MLTFSTNHSLPSIIIMLFSITMFQNSIEKWEKRVRIHFLQNFLLQNGYFLQRRRHHTTQPTSTVLMLQFTSDKIIPNFMKKILPNGVFYKYYLPFHSLIKKVPERIHSLVKTCVDTFKRKTRQQQNTTHSSQDQNKTLHKYLRKIERSMRKLEEALGRGTSRPNTTRKKLSKGRKRLNEILKRKRRQKRFRRKLNRINLLFPPPTTHDPERDGDIRDIFETTKYVTWKRKKKTLKTTRRKRNLTRTTAGVLSKKKRRKEEKLKKKRARSNKTNPKCDKILKMRESIIKNQVKRKIIEDINYRFHKKMARKNISVPEIIVPKVILRWIHKRTKAQYFL